METVQNKWLLNVNPEWDILPSYLLFTDRQELCLSDDDHLTPSQKYGVVRQADFMETTGNRVVLNLSGADKMKHVEPGDFIIHLRSFQGGIEYSTLRGKVSNAYTVLTPFSGIDHEFFRWFMKSDLLIAGLQTLTDQLRDGQTINFARFSRLSLPLPPLDTQRAIADYLDRETCEIDAMLDKLDGLGRLLEERRRNEIANAVTGGSDTKKATGGVFEQLASCFPSHWSKSRFGALFFPSNERNGDQPIGVALSVSEYHGVIPRTETEGRQQASIDVSSYRVVRPGQLAANMMWLNYGGLGVSELLGYISPAYMSFDISPRLNPRFAHYLLRSRPFVSTFAALGTGVRPNSQMVTAVQMNALPIPLPPLDEQERIVAHLDETTARIDAMLVKASELKNLLTERRSALITAAVTGQIEVQ